MRRSCEVNECSCQSSDRSLAPASIEACGWLLSLVLLLSLFAAAAILEITKGGLGSLVQHSALLSSCSSFDGLSPLPLFHILPLLIDLQDSLPCHTPSQHQSVARPRIDILLHYAAAARPDKDDGFPHSIPSRSILQHTTQHLIVSSIDLLKPYFVKGLCEILCSSL